MIVDIICFFVTFAVFMLIKPYAERLMLRIKNDYRAMHISKNLQGGGGGIEDDAEDEDIGLNKKGPKFGTNKFFNLIAEKNQGLIEEMEQLLLKAGIREDNAMEEFLKSKLVSMVALFLTLFLFLTTNDLDVTAPVAFIVSLVVGVLGGHRLTNMNIEIIASRRQEAIENGVPDLVDLLVICTESGLDLSRSIRRIARELRTSNPVLADELSLTSIEMEMIPDHKQVFDNLENRTNSLQIKTISKTLSQSIEYGSSLAVSLRDLAVESRQKRMLTAEARAAQAPTLLTLPMMFFIMPCLFIVMLGPVIVGMIKSFNGT